MDVRREGSIQNIQRRFRKIQDGITERFLEDTGDSEELE
jgi:hypothetical protein